MIRWIKKGNYETCILATEEDLSEKETQIQLFRFHSGKYRHYHKRKTEFFYFTKGKGKAIIGNRKTALSPGNWLVVKPNLFHTFINEGETTLEGIMFKTNSRTDDTFIK